VIKRWLGSSRVAVVAALLAAALTLPSLNNGLGIDDHMYRARVLEGWDAARSARDLFLYADPDRPALAREAMAAGELSWWAAPRLRWRFFRPLAQLVHHAEYKTFGRGGERLMHLHSVLWMAALAALVAVLYRRLLTPAWVAGLAAVFYAVDHGHGFTVGWLANRCMLMAGVFAVLCLIAHDRWRRDAWRPGAVLAPLALAIALLSSEESVAIGGYLVAHAVFLDRGAGRRRALALAPAAVVIAAWYLVRGAAGYGSDGTGSYTNPFDHPIAFLEQAVWRVPVYVHSLLGALPADLWEVYFVRRGLTWVMVGAGVLFTVLAVATLRHLVRRDRVASFWALGAALALIPVCAAHPTDRHLFLVGLGGIALVSQLVGAFVERHDPARRQLLPRAAAVAVAFAVVVRAGLSPVALPVRAMIPGDVSRGLDRIEALVPRDEALAQQDVVLVNAPFKYLCNFVSVVRRSKGGPVPRHWWCLGVSPDGVEVRRDDARTLALRPENGYLANFEDTNVRSRRVPFAANDRVDLDGLSITVRALTADARPREIAARFGAPLDSPTMRWLVFEDGAYRPFRPPAVGETSHLPACRFAWGDLLRGERARP